MDGPLESAIAVVVDGKTIDWCFPEEGHEADARAKLGPGGAAIRRPWQNAPMTAEPVLWPSDTQQAAPRAVATWLFVCCALVFAMVVVGGVTRLTSSGL